MDKRQVRTQDVDVKVVGLVDFNATQVTFELVSREAREFMEPHLGRGAVEFTTTKSNAEAAMRMLDDMHFRLVVAGASR